MDASRQQPSSPFKSVAERSFQTDGQTSTFNNLTVSTSGASTQNALSPKSQKLSSPIFAKDLLADLSTPPESGSGGNMSQFKSTGNQWITGTIPLATKSSPAPISKGNASPSASNAKVNSSRSVGSADSAVVPVHVVPAVHQPRNIDFGSKSGTFKSGQGGKQEDSDNKALLRSHSSDEKISSVSTTSPVSSPGAGAAGAAGSRKQRDSILDSLVLTQTKSRDGLI